MSEITIEEIKKIKHYISQVFINFGIAILGASFAISVLSITYWNLILYGLFFVIIGTVFEFSKASVPNKTKIRKMTGMLNSFFNWVMIIVMVITLLPQVTTYVGIYGFVVILVIFFLVKGLKKFI